MPRGKRTAVAVLGIFLTGAYGAVAQTTQGAPPSQASTCELPASRTVTVNGRTGKAMVLESQSGTFVNLQNLAQIGNGTVSFKQDQITLSWLVAASAPTRAAAGADDALSRDFMRAGVEAIAVIREWRSALASGLQISIAVTGSWVNEYHDRAAEAVRLAAVQASTSGDKSALQLLQGEFQNQQSWSSRMVAGRQNLNAELAVSQQAIGNDPQYQNVINCSHFLGRMLISGTFQDDAACH